MTFPLSIRSSVFQRTSKSSCVLRHRGIHPHILVWVLRKQYSAFCPRSVTARNCLRRSSVRSLRLPSGLRKRYYSSGLIRSLYLHIFCPFFVFDHLINFGHSLTSVRLLSHHFLRIDWWDQLFESMFQSKEHLTQHLAYTRATLSRECQSIESRFSLLCT